MSKNQIYDFADPLKVPVPEGTVSGDPVLVNASSALVGTALTDRGEDGEATVKFGGAFEHEVTGKKGEEEKAIAFGDKVFIDAEGNVSADSTKTFYGYAWGAVTKNKTEKIVVKVTAP